MVHAAPSAERSAFDALTRAAYQLSAADARLRGRATRQAAALSMTHARVLKLLDERGPLSVTALAEGTETSTAAVTQLLKGLVAAGYVDKQESTDDRRKVRVKLTTAGRARHRQRATQIRQWMQQTLAQHSDAELAAATAILGQLGALYDVL